LSSEAFLAKAISGGEQSQPQGKQEVTTAGEATTTPKEETVETCDLEKLQIKDPEKRKSQSAPVTPVSVHQPHV